jgi:uncharacterized membrane protein
VQIRQFGARSPAVMLRMLEVITTVIRSTRGNRDEIQILLQHAETIRQPRDRNDIEERARRSSVPRKSCWARTSENSRSPGSRFAGAGT